MFIDKQAEKHFKHTELDARRCANKRSWIQSSSIFSLHIYVLAPQSSFMRMNLISYFFNLVVDQRNILDSVYMEVPTVIESEAVLSVKT